VRPPFCARATILLSRRARVTVKNLGAVRPSASSSDTSRSMHFGKPDYLYDLSNPLRRTLGLASVQTLPPSNDEGLDDDEEPTLALRLPELQCSIQSGSCHRRPLYRRPGNHLPQLRRSATGTRGRLRPQIFSCREPEAASSEAAHRIASRSSLWDPKSPAFTTPVSVIARAQVL
jgi:hypothetical protein